MKETEASEEKLINELDSMYRRVAHLERSQAGFDGENPRDHEMQTAMTAASPPKKVVPLPVSRVMHSIGEAIEAKPGQERRPSNRRYIVGLSASIAFLGLIPVVLMLGKMSLAPRGSRPEGTSSSSIAPQATSPSAVERDQLAVRDSDETTAQGSAASGIGKGNPSPGGKTYTIQVGAFHQWENARDLMETLKRKGLEASWTDRGSKSGTFLYKVFCGHFTDGKEAIAFMKDKQILTDYPDSFVREAPGSERIEERK
jgi:cell division septation protein DedD